MPEEQYVYTKTEETSTKSKKSYKKFIVITVIVVIALITIYFLYSNTSIFKPNAIQSNAENAQQPNTQSNAENAQQPNTQSNAENAQQSPIQVVVFPTIVSIDALPSSPYFVNPYLMNFTILNIDNRTATVNFNVSGEISSLSTLSVASAKLDVIPRTPEGMKRGFNLTVSLNIPTDKKAIYNGSLNVIQNGNITTSVSITLDVTI